MSTFDVKRSKTAALWRGPDNIHGYVLDEKNPTDQDKLLLKHQLCPPFPE